MDGLSIVEESIEASGALSVLHAAVDELNRRYGTADDLSHFNVDELRSPRGTFLVARVGGDLAGGVGVRSIGSTPSSVGEVKRLWVRPDLRRSGTATTLMNAIESRSREMGFVQLYLETGYAQPEALALYRGSGWGEVENFPPGAYSHPNAYRFAKYL
ncbi:MAG: GNAT family N-acetyltransferase [Acidimicrobiaceae bacterium]|nr:GNAT family N-acetyltransferase [Acidimicrobiaceae bacterium]